MAREVFELHIRCAQCGSTLQLSYEKDARQTVQKSTSPTNVSGGYKVSQSLFVEPCRVCLEPLNKLQQALDVLRGN